MIRKPEIEDTGAEVLATGCATMAQLGNLFGTDPKTLPQRLKGVMPERKNRRGYKTYNVREAAAMLVKPGYEIEEYIRQMSPQEMPVLLGKEFWNGQRARLEYERQIGNLWPTDRIVEVVGEALNGLRMALLLMKDSVERETDLTDRQRLVLDRIMDGALAECKGAIIDKMKQYNVSDFDGFESSQQADAGDDGNILASEGDEEEDIGI